MADRPRKPSDDPLFWYGVPGADDLGQYLYDVLALVMCELEQSSEQAQDTSFDRFRNVLYRHMDELASEVNSRHRKRVIDAQLLKTEMELYRAVSRR